MEVDPTDRRDRSPHTGKPGPDLSETLWALAQTQGLLQTAVTELCRQHTRDRPKRQPSAVLTKLTPADDVEAYLEIFERTACREGWAPAEWAGLLAPFLTGEAQQAYFNLPGPESGSYEKLKTAIRAHYGYSLAARAQRYHEWAYEGNQPARAQVMRLTRLARNWLEEGDGPPVLARLVLDRCTRALPPEARKYVCQQGPRDTETLIALLENHHVTTEMGRSVKAEGPRRPGGGAPANPRPTMTRTPPRGREPNKRPLRDEQRCFGCGRRGHWAQDCPGEEAPMATAAETPAPCHYLTTCWAHEPSRAPQFPVRIAGRDTAATLDSGSAITLVRADLAPTPEGEGIAVACVHGDTREYPTTHVRIITPRGSCRQQVGVVKNLPVPVLMGRDCPLFARYWVDGPPEPQRPKEKGRGPTREAVRPAWVAPVPSGDEETPPEEPGPSRQTRSQTRPPRQGAAPDRPVEPMPGLSEFSALDGEPEDPEGRFGRAQREDPNLQPAWRSACMLEGVPQGRGSVPAPPYFKVVNGLLYRVCVCQGVPADQLLLPRGYISKALYLAHTHLLGAHLGMEKTYERLRARFYWPGIKRAVEDYCRCCAECQLHSPRNTVPSPLIPLPIIDVPFQRIGMDIVGPLPKSSRGHKYILVIMDYATRYPEAIPLRAATGKTIARELFLLFSRVGIASEVITDQGTCFMSQVMKEMCQLLHVGQVRTSVYHPQTDGLVERFNKTLKSMLRKLIEVDGKDWDKLLPYVLFAIREVPQSSTGFSPFELLYCRRPRGLLDLAKETWEQQPSRHRTLVEHVEGMETRLRQVWPMVRAHMEEVQQEQSRLYNRGAQVREFQPGDRVMVLIPTTECKFLAKWHGPYEVREKVGPVNYRVSQPGRRHQTQVYHINLLKRWQEAAPLPVQALIATRSPPQPPEVPMGTELTDRQCQELIELIGRHRDVFSEVPGRTHLAQHDIETEAYKKVRLRPYRIPEARRQAVKDEVRRMLELGVIEPSNSAWSSPIVLVPKPDGTWRFCNDFRKLNEISKYDAYPMPRIDELIERLGPARFISTLDLTRGYWQVPLTPRAREKTAFTTPEGLFHYKVLPFGVHGAPATFQRLMDRVLRPHRAYAAAYIDDIVIHSGSWEDHLERLTAVLQSLRRAGLTANPAKCRLGLEEANYLGHTVGRGCVKPQEDKVASIRTWPQPTTKRQVRTFLGLVGYYRQFVPRFATLAAPLHELTGAKQPTKVQWSPAADTSFRTLRQALCDSPILATPDFGKPFVLCTDASDVGVGAVLAQVQDGVEHPVTYISRKLLKHERNYATVEKEGLAIKWALERLQYYLLGREFVLITDHAPLKWMITNKNNNARITRWFLTLQDFKFTVEHRPGKENKIADALSRREEVLWMNAPTRSEELRRGICGIPTVIPPGATGWRRPQEWEVTPRGKGKVKKNMLGPHATRKGGGIMDSSCQRPPPFNQTEEQTFLPINQLPHSPASHSQSAGKGRKSQAQGQKGGGRMGERRLRVSRNPR